MKKLLTFALLAGMAAMITGCDCDDETAEAFIRQKYDVEKVSIRSSSDDIWAVQTKDNRYLYVNLTGGNPGEQRLENIAVESEKLMFQEGITVNIQERWLDEAEKYIGGFIENYYAINSYNDGYMIDENSNVWFYDFESDKGGIDEIVCIFKADEVAPKYVQPKRDEPVVAEVTTERVRPPKPKAVSYRTPIEEPEEGPDHKFYKDLDQFFMETM